MARLNTDSIIDVRIRITPDQRRRLERCAKYLGRFMTDIAKEGILDKIDNVEESIRRRETERQEQRRKTLLPDVDMLRPIKMSDHKPATPSKTDDKDRALEALFDKLAAYVDAGDTPEEAQRRADSAAEIIVEAADTAEEAQEIVERLRRHAVRTRKRERP